MASPVSWGPAGRNWSRAIFGAYPQHTTGEVKLNGKKLNIKSPKDAIDAGIALLTEDRKALGLFLDKSIRFNTTIRSLETISSKVLGIINNQQERKIVRSTSISWASKHHRSTPSSARSAAETSKRSFWANG